MHHLGPIWYHSEPLDVPYSQNLPRPISWFGLFLQQNNSSIKNLNRYVKYAYFDMMEIEKQYFMKIRMLKRSLTNYKT